ncbi:MAG: alginate export family protein [Bacteroidota bacterium]|nr:alginate export family protein [Bacteroidota bacterium]
MKKKFYLIVLCLNICLISYQNSEAQIIISGEIRPRAEYRHGFKTLPQENAVPAFFTEQRSRINFSYSEEKYKIGLSLQDVRVWGAVAQANKTDGFTSVHEAWGEYLFTPKFSIKAGRQELVYDDHRILGNLDWAAQARSHDVVRFIYNDSTWSFHAGAAYNQDNITPEPGKLFSSIYDPTINNYKTLQYLWYGKQSARVDYSILILNDGRQAMDSAVNFTQTYGFNPSIKINKDFKFFGSIYYQLGKDKSGREVNAYLGSANLSYSGIKSLTTVLGIDYVSGSNINDLANNKSSTFDPLYGTHHKFYGFMDYFYVGSPHGPVGLNNVYLKLTEKLSSKFFLMADVHHFAAAAKIQNPADVQQNLNSSLGTEIDLTFRYHVAKGVAMVGGYSHMFATSSMEAVKPGGGSKNAVANWAWVMVSFNPVFFTSAK